MDVSIFPTAVTDFFYTSLQKIKTERMAQDHKVQLHRAIYDLLILQKLLYTL